MTTFKVSRSYPTHQFQNWISQSEELIWTVPLLNNVLYWGAKGNGINDDTNAFNTSLSQGRAIFVPNGSYKITNTITVPSGASLNGETMSVSTLLFYNNTVNFRAIDITGFGSQVSNLTVVNRGTDFITSTAISIRNGFIFIENIRGETDDITPFAFFISFDAATSFNRVSKCITFARITTIKFTASSDRNIVSDNTVFSSGVGIDTTSSGANNLFIGNILGNAMGIVIVDIPATFIGNTSIAGLLYTGAGLIASTIYDASDTQRMNTLAGLNVNGIQVVSDRQTGWDTTTTGAAPTTIVPASASVGYVQAEITAMMQVINAMKSAMLSHGLIGP